MTFEDVPRSSRYPHVVQVVPAHSLLCSSSSEAITGCLRSFQSECRTFETAQDLLTKTINMHTKHNNYICREGPST